jgi:hypothetical protein
MKNKSLAYNTTSGEFSYIALPGTGGGDAVLASANVFTAANTFDVSINTPLIEVTTLTTAVPPVEIDGKFELDYTAVTGADDRMETRKTPEQDEDEDPPHRTFCGPHACIAGDFEAKRQGPLHVSLLEQIGPHGEHSRVLLDAACNDPLRGESSPLPKHLLRSRDM